MNKEKFFNERTDKLMKNIAVASAFIAIVGLLAVAIIFMIMYKYAPSALFA